MKGKQSQEYLTHILEAFDDQVFVLNHRGQLKERISPFLSTRKDPMAGKWIQEVFPIPVCIRILEALVQISKNAGESFRFEYEDHSETKQWFSMHIKGLNDGSKKSQEKEALLVMRDLSHLSGSVLLNTVLKSEHEELQRLNTKKDEVLSVLSHDLRSPMNSMLGLLDLIRVEGRGITEKQLKKYHGLLETNARKMESLVEDVLSWSSVNFKEDNYQPVRLNWTEEIDGVIEGLVASARKQVRIENGVRKKHFAYADRGVVRSILRNLLSNAIKFSNTGDTITVKAHESEKHFILEVRDQGIGMSEERVNALLNSSLKGVVHGTSGEKGTGMGIEMVKRFAERCGGRLEISSKPGKGSAFRVVFPAYRDDR